MSSFILYERVVVYRCVYCGCIHKKDKITVDHLIPVYKVEQSSYRNIFRKLLSAMKIDNINSDRNLVPACRRCNSKKGSKTGFWIVRGLLGKFWCYWLLMYSFVAYMLYWSVMNIEILFNFIIKG